MNRLIKAKLKYENMILSFIFLVFASDSYALDFGTKIALTINQITAELNKILVPAAGLVIMFGVINYLFFHKPISEPIKKVAIGLILAASMTSLIQLFTTNSAGF